MTGRTDCPSVIEHSQLVFVVVSFVCFISQGRQAKRASNAKGLMWPVFICLFASFSVSNCLLVSVSIRLFVF